MLGWLRDFFVSIYQYIVSKISGLRTPSAPVQPPVEEQKKSADPVVIIPIKKEAPRKQKPLQKEDKKIEVISKLLPVSKTRRTSLYSKNITAALELPATKAELEKIQNDPEELFLLCKEHLQEHAARRVDIYFYILVAVYQTQLQFKQSNTFLQHGKGRQASQNRRHLTHACHSSLFPTLVDYSKDKKNTGTSSILSGTHFMDTMNATVELPVFANQLDSVLEGKIQHPSLFREKSLEILQIVAEGKLNPIEGLKEFLETAKNTFNLLESGKPISQTGTSYLNRQTKGAPKQIKLKLLDTEKAGTFCYENDASFDEYIHLLLRLKPEEIAQCQNNPEYQKEIYLQKFRSLKEEILTTPCHQQQKIMHKK